MTLLSDETRPYGASDDSGMSSLMSLPQEVLAMRHEEYQGWTNYETWQATLWIGNDENLYRVARYIAQTAPIAEQPDILREMIEAELIEGKPASLETDILTAWLQEVDWDAAAEAQRDE